MKPFQPAQALKRKSPLARVMKEVLVQSPCPMCHQPGGVHLLTVTVNVPYFGDGLETTLRCDACGFRHADFMILSQKEPVRLTYHAKHEAALSTRVIRSNSGTIRIPELGFLAEPTPLSESFVSNVEGVLERARDILLTAVEFFGSDEEKLRLLHEYLETYDRLVNGRQPFSLVIDDPYGNSAIVSDKVERRLLPEEEVAELKTGMVFLDKEDLEGLAE